MHMVPKSLPVHVTDIPTNNSVGMTKTSPASFMTFTNDPIEKRLLTVGKILPHMRAKVISADGIILTVGSRGELCVAGFALQKGYWKNPEKTAEVMRVDEDGNRWMHTGDEATIDSEGYCRITGRIKDIIIPGLILINYQLQILMSAPGGENIFPLEIEERLAQHPSIIQASVVGIPDNKYGEVVDAFLQPRLGGALPSSEKLVLELLCKSRPGNWYSHHKFSGLLGPQVTE